MFGVACNKNEINKKMIKLMFITISSAEDLDIQISYL